MLEHAEIGTLIILGICSVLAVAVILERLLALWRVKSRQKRFQGELKPLLVGGDEDGIKAACGQSKAPLASVLNAVYEVDKKLAPEQTKILMSQAMDELGDRLKRFLSILATLAGTAPFIGLFGTVLGIMHTFQSIAQKGFGNPAHLAGGISMALTATAAGLAVAIPAVVFYNLFARKVNATMKSVRGEANQILIMLGKI